MTASRWRLCLLAVVALTAGLCMAEGTLRLAGWEHTPLKIDVRNRADSRSYHLFEDRHFAADPDLIWRPKAGVGIFNAQGYRGSLVTADKAADEIRIFAFGDSNTLGWDTPDGSDWPGSLDQLLRESASTAQVINAGVWGYTSFQGLRRLQEALPLAPDIALISFGSNDAQPVTRPDRFFVQRGFVSRRFERWLLGARLGQLALATRDVLAGATEAPYQPRVPLDEYRANLAAMADLTARHHIRIVFLTRPYVGPIDTDWSWKNSGHLYNRATSDIAGQKGALLVDFYSYFKGKGDLFADESHFNDAGHAAAAAYLLDTLGDPAAAVGSDS